MQKEGFSDCVMRIVDNAVDITNLASFETDPCNWLSTHTAWRWPATRRKARASKTKACILGLRQCACPSCLTMWRKTLKQVRKARGKAGCSRKQEAACRCQVDREGN
eukprot:731752-Amphidinium_carterae.2